MPTPQPNNKTTTQKRVQPHEKKTLLLLALIFVLFKIGLEITGNFAEVIYFRRMGIESLPLLYSVEPLALVFVLVIFGLISDHINRHTLLLSLNLIFAFLLLIARILILADWQQVYFLLYISQRIFFALLPLAFWLVCSDLFDIRQAKRLFVLIIASGLVGTLLGNLLTGLLSGFFSPEDILILTSLFFIASLGVGIWLSRLSLPKSFVKAKVTDDESFPPILPLDLLKQPFIQIFTLLILITGVLEPIWRYELNAIANQAFTSESNLIAFIGYFKGVAVLVVILFQLFLAGKLMQKIGIPWAISTHPLGLVGVMILLAFYPLLWMAVASIALVGIVRIGFDETGRKAIMGIYPLHERTRVSTFERQMNYFGIFLGGLFLIWAVEHLTLMQINWIAAAFAATWIFAFPRFRAQYAQVCLRRGKSPLDGADLPPTGKIPQVVASFEQFIAKLPPTSYPILIQGAALRDAHLNHVIRQELEKDDGQIAHHLQLALRSSAWSVCQLAAQILLNGSALSGIGKPKITSDTQISIQLDYADQLWKWREIPQIQKLIEEERTAAAQAILLLLEGVCSAKDMRVAARMLHSPDADMRANGLEALDITLRGEKKSRLMALFESVFSASEPSDTPEINAAKIWQEMAQSPASETAFWGQVWMLRSGESEYVPPNVGAQTIPDELAALLAAVIYPQTGDDAMKLADKIDALRASTTFATLSETELRVLAQCTREANYDSDTIIFEEGQLGNALYLILEGHVELASVEEKKSLQALGAGGIFGENALFSEEPYRLTAVTISHTRILILERETFLELIQYYPNLSLSLLRDLAQRFEKATALLQKVWV